MINRKLNKTVGEFYRRGLIDETFIMEAVSKTLGGSCEKSSSKEDIEDHIDFWWDSPKKGRIPMDAKGIKKNSRSDKSFDDTIHWLELQNVNGKPGWLYGKAEYIAFRTFERIIFVKREKLLSFALEMISGKDVVYDTPKEFYVPYKRKKWGRDDLSIKVPTSDLLERADFCIDY
jgi:hypothetical protein